MKKLIRLSLAVVALATCSSQVYAAFPIKQEAKQTTEQQTAAPAATTAAPVSAEAIPMATETATVTEVKKQGFFQRLFGSHKAAAAMPQGVYILLSIFFLGWLAIGINDDWQGYDWLIALLLYLLLWLPGFIYSLIVMGRFY